MKDGGDETLVGGLVTGRRSPGKLARRLVAVILAVAMTNVAVASPAQADGTEALGVPSVAIASGNGLVADGVGLVAQPGVIDLEVPASATVEQVLVYWEGFSSSDTTGFDDTIEVNGTAVTGTPIGGPTFFFGGPANRHYSTSFRADITGLGVVSPGSNSVEVGGLTFDRQANGAGIIVVTDDPAQPTASLDLVDGNDVAFANFPADREVTVPQTLNFAPATVDRVGTLTLFASSVEGQDRPGDRPNIVLITIDGVVTQYDNLLGSNDGLEWDTLRLPLDIPANISSVEVQLVSADPAVPATGQLPASLVWIAAAMHVADSPLAGIGDRVFFDTDGDGIQDGGEVGVAGVLVELLQNGVVIDDQTTVFGGLYFFGDLTPGDYQVRFTAPPGQILTLQDQGADDALDSDADPATGLSQIVTLAAGELNRTVDAGLVDAVPGIDIEKLTNGNQADGANDADVPQIAAGDTVTWTYIVTNTGDVPYDQADVTVTDDTVGGLVLVDDGNGDTVLSPGEVWTYEATGTADDLDAPSAGTTVVDGCNPDGTTVPGDRATYENIGTVTVPGDTDTDPSHYCNPPDPGIDIEKLTNGNQADGANDADVPQIAAGDTVTWTYIVTNTGDVPYAEVDVVVADDTVGGLVLVDDGDSDGVLSPGEVWTYEATGTALDLDAVGPIPATIVDGCNPDGTAVPGDRATYENIGTVTVPGDTDTDPSHYCNPPDPGIDIEKLTNGNQADGANDTDVPQIAAGDTVTWTYIVTNTGDVAFAQADVTVADDTVAGLVLVDDGNSDGVLSPGEVWTYEVTGTADDLANPTAGTTVVDGCNPDGTTVPGDRATYENIGTVTVPGDTDTDPSHYCNLRPASLGDFVWKDLDGDGIQDVDEPGVGGVEVKLWTAELGTPNAVVDSTTTAGDGSYQFTGLTPGQQYVVQFVPPPLMPLTLQDQGGDDSVDSDADPTDGFTDVYVLAPGEYNDTVDAGLVNADEPECVDFRAYAAKHHALWIPGVSSTLLPSGDGLMFTEDPATGTARLMGEVSDNGSSSRRLVVDITFTGFTMTAPAGSPKLELHPDNYVPVGPIDPATWRFYTAYTGTLTGLGSWDGLEIAIENTGPAFQAGEGASGKNQNNGAAGWFLYDIVSQPHYGGHVSHDNSHGDINIDLVCKDDLPASLGDRVWKDIDENGIQDPGEPGVSGVTVNLWTAEADGTPLVNVDSAATGASGDYRFDGLTPGQTYVVQFVAPDGMPFTSQNSGGDDSVDSDADETTGITGPYVLAGGEYNDTVDAGVTLDDDVHIHIEHEHMRLYNCWIERVDGASNGKVIKGKPWTWCKAKTVFDGPAGVYTIMTDYYDEDDGESPFYLFVNNELVDSWTADQDLGSGLPNDQTKVRRSTLEVTLRPGDLIIWKVKPKGHEYGRLDMTWIQKTGEIPPPPPMQMFEAEDMRRRYVWIDHVSAASGNKVVKTAKNKLGYVKMTYQGSAGDFALSTTYFDENDGQSKYWVYINGVKIDEWVADEDLASNLPVEANRVERDNGTVHLEPGDRIKIYVKGNHYEYGRLDKITLRR